MPLRRSSTGLRFFSLNFETDEEDVAEGLAQMVAKMQATLDYCRDVAEKRTPFRISQSKVILQRIE